VETGNARRAERLGSVLDQRRAEAVEDVERRRAAEQMNRHDRAGPARDPASSVLLVEVQRHRIDVREDRSRTAARDRFRSRVERESGTDDLVAGADSHRVEDKDERVGAVGDADRLLDAEIRGRLLFERLHVRPADERRGVENPLEPLPQLLDQRRVLRLHINERDRQHGGPV
jgi:hypothetical protein